MKGPTHQLVGASVAIAGAQALQLSLPVGAGLAAVAYASSKLPDQLELGILKHRGPTHRLWMPFAVATVVGILAIVAWRAALTHHVSAKVITAGWVVMGVVVGGVLVGYGAHLLADMCTVSGLQVGRKNPRKLYLLPRILRINTTKPNSVREGIFVLLVVSAVVLYMALTHVQGDV